MKTAQLSHKKLYIFDWDGTVMDSIAHIVSSIQVAGRKVGVEIAAEDAKNIIGLGLPEAVKILFPQHQDQSKLIQQAYKEDNNLHSAESPLYEGIADLLSRLQKQGKILAVATGKSRKSLDHMLENTEVGALFYCSRGADETKSKPDPLMLIQILGQTGVDVADAVMIGDTSYDMEMARNIGMDRVAVTYGVHDQEVLEQYQPTALVHDGFELANVLTDNTSGEPN